MKVLLKLVGAGLMLAAGGVSAQDAPDPAGPDTETAAAPAPIETLDLPPAETPEMEDTQSANYTDQQIAAFVSAALQMRGLNADSEMDDLDRRTRAQMIIAQEGLDPATYSAIGEAANTDPSVAQRVQMAIEAAAQEPQTDR